jgi:phosphonopyruvate decarboxylase
MIAPEFFYKLLLQQQLDFYAGVPDSLLKDICAYITDHTSAANHIITANEGNAIGIAAGYHMATGKIPLVYMQNSGIGNTVNPLLSLADEKVYSIPILLLIGWRGEPGIEDEPQHVKQGEVTLDLLKAMKIPYIILGMDEIAAGTQIKKGIEYLKNNNSPYAIVIKKGTFEKYSLKKEISAASYEMSREDAIKRIVDHLDGNEIIVSTTGKTSRELFEYRAKLNQPHYTDFLTVGSMGHSSQIALGIALQKPDKRIICLDGDGALLMHMGGLSIIGCIAPKNFIHIVINNGAHESVGGQPTVGFNIDIPKIALANNYKVAVQVETVSELDNAFSKVLKDSGPSLIEVKVNLKSRSDLGRPTVKPIDNKIAFMKNLE